MNVEKVIQKPNFWYSPAGKITAIGGIVILWTFMRGNPTTLVLGSIAILFLFGLRRPLWALVALLLSQFTITSYKVDIPFFSISLRLLLLLITVFILIPAFREKQIELGPQARKLIIPILCITVSVLLRI